jgi:hypothetical protein
LGRTLCCGTCSTTCRPTRPPPRSTCRPAIARPRRPVHCPAASAGRARAAAPALVQPRDWPVPAGPALPCVPRVVSQHAADAAGDAGWSVACVLHACCMRVSCVLRVYNACGAGEEYGAAVTGVGARVRVGGGWVGGSWPGPCRARSVWKREWARGSLRCDGIHPKLRCACARALWRAWCQQDGNEAA